MAAPTTPPPEAGLNTVFRTKCVIRKGGPARLGSEGPGGLLRTEYVIRKEEMRKEKLRKLITVQSPTLRTSNISKNTSE